MPKIDLQSVQNKTKPYDAPIPKAAQERITLAVPASFARKVKAYAALRGTTIKQLVCDALIHAYPDLI